MVIVEIFNSIEGEGIRAGYLCTFIRLAECNLRCRYCDSMYSYSGEYAHEYKIHEILEECKQYSTKRITVTGGEPLLHENIEELLQKLSDNGYEVNVETNGSIPLDCVHRNKKIFFTMDYKCPSSLMEEKMCLDNLSLLTERDVLKFVVGTHTDMQTACDCIRSYRLPCHIFFSPVWGEIEPSYIVDFMKKQALDDCRIQVQLHKIIWPASMMGV